MFCEAPICLGDDKVCFASVVQGHNNSVECGCLPDCNGNEMEIQTVSVGLNHEDFCNKYAYHVIKVVCAIPTNSPLLTSYYSITLF